MKMSLGLAPGAQAQSQAPIKIGASAGLTGVYAEFGLAIQRGYQLCVKAANAKGGLLGRKLEMTLVDDKSDTAAAVAIYERLITQDKGQPARTGRLLNGRPDEVDRPGW